MNPPLATTKYENGKINISIFGNLTEERISELELAIKEAGEKIIAEYQGFGQKVRVLFDMSQFEGEYDVKALELMTELAKGDIHYVEKTAIFGGAEKGSMAGSVVAALSGRDNIKIFAEKGEALTWLNT